MHFVHLVHQRLTFTQFTLRPMCNFVDEKKNCAQMTGFYTLCPINQRVQSFFMGRKE